MAEAGSNRHPNASSNGGGRTPDEARPSVGTARRKTPWPLVIIAVLFVVVPFLAWYGTWFGRELTDAQIEEYLAEDKPRHVQHALSQIEKRIARGDAGAARWYGRVAALAESQEKEVRLTAAWVMGADTRSEEFHEKLLRLLEDAEPVVRRNAALSLVGFKDARALPELRAMLKPYSVRADRDGTAHTALTEGSRVRREALLVRATDAAGAVFDLRSPLEGKVERAAVKDGERFTKGSELFVLAPDAVSVGDALRALGRVGGPEDLPELERYARGVEGMPDFAAKRAGQSAEEIKRRAAR
ncbi:MAG TPA: HEAT repeat domain-containing protein [Pyrinomonadaceae bacterium]|nr:HEAT repeat domain-containing protein [Pyrinomonadaceae bacterium]